MLAKDNQPQILMCPPTHYDIRYEINPWMHVENGADRPLAQQQWRTLHDTFVDLGVNVQLIDAKDHPDMVFSANAGLLHKNTFVPSAFRFAERQGEEEYWKQWFADAGYTIETVPAGMAFEGAGDALFAGETLIGGHGFRSDASVYPHLAGHLGCPVEVVELVDDRFYHLDTCFCPLNGRQAIFYPDAFAANARHTLDSLLECHAVPEAEAIHFACNAVVLGKDVVMPAGCPQTADLLTSLGFTVHPVELTEYIKSGGAAKCLTIRLDRWCP